jgi:hypothetical protein
MEVHRPKAVHGWRELLSEVGVIVIGIAIALSGEQLIEALHWRHQAEAGEASLKRDYARELQNAARRDIASVCIARRLDALTGVVQTATVDGALPPSGPIGHPPYTPWTIRAWDALVASQTVSHLPRGKQIAYTEIAQLTRYLSDLSDQEHDQWTILGSLYGPGRRLSDAEAEQLRIALARAKDSDIGMRQASARLRLAVKATGLLAPNEVAEAEKTPADDKDLLANCGPLPPLSASEPR